MALSRPPHRRSRPATSPATTSRSTTATRATRPSVAGQPGWADQVRAQNQAYVAANGPVDPYRALYGADAPDRAHYASWGKRVLAYLFDSVPRRWSSRSRRSSATSSCSASLETTTDATATQTLDRRRRQRRPPSACWSSASLLSLAFGSTTSTSARAGPATRFGKTVVGIKLVERGRRHSRSAPLMSFVRSLAHIVDGLLLHRLPLADLGRQEPDVRGQDHEHDRDRAAAGRAERPGGLRRPSRRPSASRLRQTRPHVDDPHHRRVLRPRRRDGPPARRARPRPRAVRATYRQARRAARPRSRRPTPAAGSRSGRST